MGLFLHLLIALASRWFGMGVASALLTERFLTVFGGQMSHIVTHSRNAHSSGQVKESMARNTGANNTKGEAANSDEQKLSAQFIAMLQSSFNGGAALNTDSLVAPSDQESSKPREREERAAPDNDKRREDELLFADNQDGARNRDEVTSAHVQSADRSAMGGGSNSDERMARSSDDQNADDEMRNLEDRESEVATKKNQEQADNGSADRAGTEKISSKQSNSDESKETAQTTTKNISEDNSSLDNKGTAVNMAGEDTDGVNLDQTKSMSPLPDQQASNDGKDKKLERLNLSASADAKKFDPNGATSEELAPGDIITENKILSSLNSEEDGDNARANYKGAERKSLVSPQNKADFSDLATLNKHGASPEGDSPIVKQFSEFVLHEQAQRDPAQTTKVVEASRSNANASDTSSAIKELLTPNIGSKDPNASGTALKDTVTKDVHNVEKGNNSKALVSSRGAEILERIQKIVMNSVANKDVSTVTLRLDPPTLGTVTVKLTQKGDELAARIIPESPEVEQLLKSKTGEIVAALSGSGVKLENINVTIGTAVQDAAPKSFDDMLPQGFENGQGNGRGRNEAGSQDEPQLFPGASLGLTQGNIVDLSGWVA